MRRWFCYGDDNKFENFIVASLFPKDNSRNTLFCTQLPELAAFSTEDAWDYKIFLKFFISHLSALYTTLQPAIGTRSVYNTSVYAPNDCLLNEVFSNCLFCFVHIRNIEWLITLFEVLKTCFNIFLFVCMAFISSLMALNLLHEWLHNKDMVRTLCTFSLYLLRSGRQHAVLAPLKISGIAVARK